MNEREIILSIGFVLTVVLSTYLNVEQDKTIKSLKEHNTIMQKECLELINLIKQRDSIENTLQTKPKNE